MNKLIIMCGVIGSGKTTWIKNYLKENPDTLIVSKDDIRKMLHGGKYIYDKSLEPLIDFHSENLIRDLIYEKKGVIIDECNLSKRDRTRYFDPGSSPEIIIVYFPPKNKKWHVDRRMTDCYGISRETWKSVYDEMIETLEPPTQSECDKLIIVMED